MDARRRGGRMNEKIKDFLKRAENGIKLMLRSQFYESVMCYEKDEITLLDNTLYMMGENHHVTTIGLGNITYIKVDNDTIDMKDNMGNEVEINKFDKI